MKKLLLILAPGLAVTVGFFGFAALSPRSPERIVVLPETHFPFDSQTIELQIRSNQEAVRKDPFSALGWSMMASAYMAQSREADDGTSAVLAELSARKSLGLRKLGNSGAWNKLDQSLLQQHRFRDALSECESAEKALINDDGTTALHVECLIEIGRYPEAAALISKCPRAFSEAPGEAIVARLEEITGDPDRATQLLRKATAEMDANGGIASDALAWFHTRLATCLLKTGHHSEAREEFGIALNLYPRNYKAMAGLARLAFQEQRWKDAIEWGARCDQIAQMADVRALVGDSYAQLGETDLAQEQYARVAALVGRPSGMNDDLHEVAPAAGTHGHRLDRQYAIYCADHQQDPEGAYAAALRDLEARQDVYAYDTLGWVCLQRGDKAEARKAVLKALEFGTRDAMLWYHAGVILYDCGDEKSASQYLNGALGIDPQFDGLAASRAKALLAQIQKRGGRA